MSSFVPAATSAGARTLARSSVRSAWREPRRQAASARRSDRVCSANSAERLAHRVGHVGDRRQFERARRRRRAGPRLSTSLMPTPPRISRAHPLRLARRQHRADARAERIAHHVGACGARDARSAPRRRRPSCRCDSRPDRRAWSIGHGRDCRARSRGGRRASASRPSRADPVHLLVGGKAVHQDDRIALALVEIGDLDVSVSESWHECCAGGRKAPPFKQPRPPLPSARSAAASAAARNGAASCAPPRACTPRRMPAG